MSEATKVDPACRAIAATLDVALRARGDGLLKFIKDIHQSPLPYFAEGDLSAGLSWLLVPEITNHWDVETLVAETFVIAQRNDQLSDMGERVLWACCPTRDLMDSLLVKTLQQGYVPTPRRKRDEWDAVLLGAAGPQSGEFIAFLMLHDLAPDAEDIPELVGSKKTPIFISQENLAARSRGLLYLDEKTSIKTCAHAPARGL